jgi:DNA-binding beta-propeller fold protein YncE
MRYRFQKIQRLLGNMLFVFLLSFLLLTACGSPSSPSRVSVPSPTTVPSPPATATAQLDTGPKGLPLYCPQGMAFDTQGNMYVADNDTNTDSPTLSMRLVKLSPSGQLLAEWHLFKPTGGLEGPGDVVLDAHNSIYVSDTGDDTIKKISPTGQVLAVWGGSGSDPGQFSLPFGLALDREGNIYVADFYNSRVQKLSPEGRLLAVIGTTGAIGSERIDHPLIVAVDAQGNIYVSEHRRLDVLKFSAAGQFLAAWSFFARPGAVQVDGQGNVYVPDLDNQRIVKLTATGKTLALWENLDVAGPLAVDAQNNVYAAVGEHGALGLHGTIVKFSPNGKQLSVFAHTTC